MLEISDGDLIAQIMEEGAYLYSLTKSGKDVILKGKERKTHGGMALLIPYANRVKDGEYIWEDKKYELPKNSEGNAIHGLIMDKLFDVKFKGKSRVTLEYLLSHPGYPSTLRITITYSVVFDLLDVFITVKNEGEVSAPLVVGAHPYFLVRGKWSITPDRVRRCLMENKIPTGNVEDFRIVQKDYDDCFIIENREITLKSDYSTVAIEKSNMDYIQLYTGEPGAVAVEPMSGAPDAYHNGLGLIILEPSKSRDFNFTISAVIH
ncbi:aldose 1-epimerase [Acidianus brierleyi]|uniref:Aldose 1-epimerase n=1 Tax=Acidianus brierleyi TaxID=41673 RepID=A0A2U9IC72_9CREN|nr:aldose 1-epimerase [Acidianus brierleyi]AWR93625.1 aldose 1-epimerase [Acidianus brierleyi]